MNKKYTYFSAFNAVIAWLSSKMLSFFKISFVIGSQHALLSCSSMMLPLIGFYGGILGSIAFFGLNLGLRGLFGNLSGFSLLAFYIPGLCASLYFASHHWFIRVFLPLICMIAFMVHPIGGLAWVYSMYWLIPIAVYFVKPHHFFYQALGATFTAHAVGSIIWLYTAEMTAAMWCGLIPVVACERLMYAAGMVIAQYIVQSLPLVCAHMSNMVFWPTGYRRSYK